MAVWLLRCCIYSCCCCSLQAGLIEANGELKVFIDQNLSPGKGKGACSGNVSLLSVCCVDALPTVRPTAALSCQATQASARRAGTRPVCSPPGDAGCLATRASSAPTWGARLLRLRLVSLLTCVRCSVFLGSLLWSELCVPDGRLRPTLSRCLVSVTGNSCQYPDNWWLP